MPRPLKVFAAPMGFYETVVAAPSRKAALEAWGTSQDLFKGGEARPADDTEAVRAALAHPGVVLKRPAGGKGPWSETPPAPRPSGRPAKVRKPPDRSALTRAEKALARETAAFEKRRAALSRRLESLESELDSLAREQQAREAALQEAVGVARAAFRAAGGRD